MKSTAILLIDCPDRKGIVAAVGEFLYRHDANILHADQHQDAERNLFLMRVEWDLAEFKLNAPEFTRKFAPIADRFEMRWRLELSSLPHRVALFVSKYDHCLADLLYRHQSGELPCEIPLVVSNHPDAKRWADFFGVPFHVTPVGAGNKAEVERQQMELLHDHRIDLVVLARYMQVLSPDFVARFPRLANWLLRTTEGRDSLRSVAAACGPVPWLERLVLHLTDPEIQSQLLVALAGRGESPHARRRMARAMSMAPWPETIGNLPPEVVDAITDELLSAAERDSG